MPSYQIAIEPHRRAAARFVVHVRRALQKAFVEEQKARGLSQAEIARLLNVNRSVINRELKGFKDITLGRVAELAWAMGRKAAFSVELPVPSVGTNVPETLPRPAPRALNAPIAPSGSPSSSTTGVLNIPGTISSAAA